MDRKTKIFLSWLYVSLCALSIFLIVPLARTIQKFVSDNWARSAFGFAVLAAVGAAFLILSAVLFLRLKIRTPTQYFWLAAVTAAYVYFTLKLWKNPEEAVHFLEYGLLGFFLFRAFRFHIKDKSIFLAAFSAGALIGIWDEILQWAVPGRYWDIRDVGLNALSCALFQLALWKGIKPKMPETKISPHSFKINAILISMNLILLGLCYSNTPARVRTYTKALPFLSFLERQEAMSEYKYQHEDPDIGVFFSRLSKEELYQQDSERAQEFGDVLTFWSGEPYADYLDHFPGSVHPFLHEIRVHIFRRDRRLELALFSDDPNLKKENLFIAYKENQILEKYFGNSLAGSPYQWEPQKSQNIAQEIDITATYRSPVSADVFAALNETYFWGLILIIIGIIWIGYFVHPHSHNKVTRKK
ncbi:MAG: VanZ family protein [Candidatus Aminicenantes bacterium]|nr:VanZ family protein [Candidatus Aminicenantes bacterium]